VARAQKAEVRSRAPWCDVPRHLRVVAGVVAAVSLAACASYGSQMGSSTEVASASPGSDMSTTAPSPDPRVGLKAGWMDAGQALWNLRLVSATPPPEGFIDRSKPGDFRFINSDLAFTGHYVVQGNFWGIQIWDVADSGHPRAVTAMVCPGSQNDVSVYRDLLFVSVESPAGRVDCGTQGVQDSVSPDRMRGIRIYDISDIRHPRAITNVQTCRGSHTHTVVTSPSDPDDVYIYVSGQAPVRSPSELAGCSAMAPDQDPGSELFRIEVIQVPLAHPEQAKVVSKPAILAGLTEAAEHGPAAGDIAAAKKEAAAARAEGKYTAVFQGIERVLPDRYVNHWLDSLVAARGGSGAPTAQDSATLRASVQGIVDARFNPPPGPGGVRPGPVQCHDITVYPEIGLAGGACAGYGLLLDIRDPVHPKRVAAVSDSNFAYWHSATFSNDGRKILFTDEWGGGLQARCRATDPRMWGADAMFERQADNSLTFEGYYKLPAPQTAQENCVAHNGSLIPVPGRDIFVQAWYQGGISVIDWTDPAHPKEIAFFDRGPMDATKLVGAGSWSAYWYNGHIYSSEIARGLDILDLVPSGLLSQNEIDAAKQVRFDQLNVQDQQRLVWPKSVAVARAYLDQLGRSHGLTADRLAAAREGLTRAASLSGAERSGALESLARRLESYATESGDAAKVRLLASTLRGEASVAK
jgi:hypothetical protein